VRPGRGLGTSPVVYQFAAPGGDDSITTDTDGRPSELGPTATRRPR